MKIGITINKKRVEKYFKTKEEAELWRNKIRKELSDKSLQDELWKNIPNFSMYQASNFGRLRSLNYKRSGIIKVLNPSISNDGYLKTMLLNDSGKYNSCTVHKFITLAFYGSRPPELEVNHIDGNKLNNNINNLEYCTRSENCKHAVRIGLWEVKRGEKNGMAKLTQAQVDEAREAKRTKGRFWGRNEMAKRFGINAKHLQRIVNNPTVLWPIN